MKKVKKVSKESYKNIYTRKVYFDMLPKECVMVLPEDENSLDKGNPVRYVRVRLGSSGYFERHSWEFPQFFGLEVSSWEDLNRINAEYYNITDLNIINVMAGQSFHGNYQGELDSHNEEVERKAK